MTAGIVERAGRVGEYLRESLLSLAGEGVPVAAIKVDSKDLSSDIHADAEYRAHLVTVMAKKAVTAALQTL